MLDNIILSTYRLESPHTLPCGKGWANTKKNSGTEKIRGGGDSCRINLMKIDQTSCYRLPLSKL